LIILHDIWKSEGSGRKKKDLLCGVNAILDTTGGHLGILGEKQGKAVLLNIIAGATQADHGRVFRTVRVSWPLTWRGFGNNFTGDQQVFFMARVYQVDGRETLRFVTELSGLGRKIYETLGTYTPKEKDRLMFALALALDFDVYLIDEAAPAIDPPYESAFTQAWQECMKARRMIVATCQPPKLNEQFAHAWLLEAGRLSSMMTPQEARQAFQRRARRRKTAVPK
jgi:capsular polysaccharide transport system ATP-binding protein